MLSWFHTLSNLQIGAVVLTFGLLCTTVAPVLVRRAFTLTPSEHLAKGAEESFKLFISLTLLLLAFCLVRMQGDHRGTEDMVAREGAVMIKLDRAYQAFGGDKAPRLRATLREYGSAVVEDEWKVLEDGGRSGKASAALNTLLRESRELEPQTVTQQVARSEMLQALLQMSDLREARIAASRLKLPTYYWYAILASMTFLTVFGWLQNPLSKLGAYVGGVTCGLGLLMTLLISTAGIYVGESAVTPEPIQDAMRLIGKVANGAQL